MTKGSALMSNPNGRLAGKVAIVSGGAGGIGAAVVRTFVGEGAQVVIGDLLAAEGKALAAELGAASVFQELDVRQISHLSFSCWPQTRAAT
jgi:3alpha(or 20beta)-hydroxysteroid dehydrogenase